MRTRNPDEVVWRLAMRNSISCPQCGKRMRKISEARL